MITVENCPRPRRLARFWRRRKKVVALFSYRFDAHLVPALIENITPIVDAWIAYDDRNARGVFTDEMARRRELLKAARDIGADWIIAVDPDERFEARVAARIHALTARRGRVAWSFNLREMYGPAAYRIDGLWGTKKRYRLFTAFDPAELPDAGLHNESFPAEGGFSLRDSDLNLYHLKMIDPKRRAGRRDLYNFLDPERAYQAIGYDYLADEEGAVLEEIPAGRHYLPPHVDDGGLWMYDLASPAQSRD